MPTEIQNQELPFTMSAEVDAAVSNPFQENNFLKESDLPDLAADLTDEDKKYLALKWGRLYKPSEWI